MKFFKKSKSDEKTILLEEKECSALVHFPGNKKQKFELNRGTSFLAQTTRHWLVPTGANKIEFFNAKGNLIRTINTP